MTKKWDAKLVMASMVEAFEVLYDSSGRVGPALFQTAWPEYKRDLVDGWYQKGMGLTNDDPPRARIRRTPEQVSRSELILYGGKIPNGLQLRNWGAQFLTNAPLERKCLMFHVHGKADANLRGRGFSAKRFYNSRGWSESTYRTRRDRGASIIAHGLNEIGLRPF